MTSRKTAPSRPSPLTVGTELDVAFTDLLSNGQAVGRAGGMAVFCFGPLPRESARVAITSVKQKYAVAEMIRLIAGSPFRVQPFCPVFGTCGGCQLQHLSYPAQLAWKRDVVRNALTRIGGFDGVQVRDTIGAIVPRAYRNKMSLVVEHRTGAPAIGFYKQRSHDVVPIDDCPIVLPQLGDYISRLNAARLDDEIAPAFAQARHIVARASRATGQATLTVTTPHASEDVAAAAPALKARLPGVAGVTNSFDPSGDNAILGRKLRVLAGAREIEETIAGIRYRISPASFFQVNVEIVSRIFEFMKRGLNVPRRVVDLYCGAGTFALFFAKHGCDVFGIEENAAAAEEAGANAELNGLQERVTVQTGRVEELVRGGAARDALRRAQIVFLDPPRKGSDEATLGAVAAAGVPNVWYLSCDPATLARDLKFLTAKGYRFGVVQPFDMFPQTGHVETLVTLYSEAGAARITVEDAFEGAPPPAAWPADDRFAHDRPEYPDFVIRED
ncbi:MAG: 23S rRNA (uracil(1939)-C(5))-methyltransferase RlmD [Candidatus Eremiobacteraeota bacterium]|nr:23S rRNA (uracil(1939)-C(5))-methyltransferase RlmD [Candidatus Eremiobacteraeota bacterium]MBV8720721.1 23S rRNA (uracil(1939)-C(5))-methyltransferase RlmD [Candidatus Eremiobacteraeota bacterium]